MTLEYLFDLKDEFCWLMPQHLMAFPSDDSCPPEPDTLKVQLCKRNMQLVPPVTRKQQRVQDQAVATAMGCHAEGSLMVSSNLAAATCMN